MARKLTDFYLGDEASVAKLADSIEADYTKEEITDRLKVAREYVRRGPFVYRDKNGVAVKAPKDVTNVFGPYAVKSFYTANKRSLALALAYYRFDDRNADPDRKQSSESARESLAIFIASEGAADFKDVTEICGQDSIRLTGAYWSQKKIKLFSGINDFRAWISGVDYWDVSSSDVFVSLPKHLAEKYIRMAYPDEADNLSSLPGGEGSHTIVNRQSRTGNLLTIASTMMESGTLAPGSVKLMNKADLKKFLKLAAETSTAATDGMTPLGDGNEEQSFDAMVLMTVLLREYVLDNYYMPAERAALLNSADPADMAVAAVDLSRNYRDIPQFVRLFLPGIIGVSKTTVSGMAVTQMVDYVREQLTRDVDGTGDDAPVWRSVKNLLTDVYVRAEAGECELLMYHDGKWGKVSVDYKGKPAVVRPTAALDTLTFRFVRCYLFYLTAMGMLETAFRRTEGAGTSVPFEEMSYFRLTPLGRYAFGLGPKPDLSSDSEFNYRFELVDNPLIVVSLNPQNPINVWLDRIGNRRGNRWIITPGSFLKECATAGEIESLTEEFRRFICAEPPAAWNEFFERLKRNAGTGSLKAPKDDYVVCDVNPANSDLLAFLTSDTEIRRLVVRAEGYRIMVRAVDMALFRKAMRRGGFLV